MGSTVIGHQLLFSSSQRWILGFMHTNLYVLSHKPALLPVDSDMKTSPSSTNLLAPRHEGKMDDVDDARCADS